MLEAIGSLIEAIGFLFEFVGGIVECFKSFRKPKRLKDSGINGVKSFPCRTNKKSRYFIGNRNGIGMIKFFGKSDPEAEARAAASELRQGQIKRAIIANAVPDFMRERLNAARDGTAPWTSTLSPAELLIARSHGIRPIAAVSATCWLAYGRSWTEGHMEGWDKALRRLCEEAKAVGANAVVDVKMRTIELDIANSMDFTLVGTAVKVDGLPPSSDPIVATVPALEFVRLLENDIVPTGIAVGANFRWMNDWQGNTNLMFQGNTESLTLSMLWENVRRAAYNCLRDNAKGKGNGVLAHIDFSEMFEVEMDRQPKQYLARHIIIATTVDVPNHSAARYSSGIAPMTMDFQMVVDMHAGKTPLKGTIRHHQSYPLNDGEGAI